MNNLLKLINSLGKNLHNELTIRQLSKESNLPYTSRYSATKIYTQRRVEEIFENARKFIAK